jgi:hypothetical protein
MIVLSQKTVINMFLSKCDICMPKNDATSNINEWDTKKRMSSTLVCQASTGFAYHDTVCISKKNRQTILQFKLSPQTSTVYS